MKRSHALLAGLALALAVPAAPLAADWRLFLPQPVDNDALLELFAARESEELGADARGADWSDTFFAQKLTLGSDGYVYHPRFLQYHLSLGALFKQEEYASSSLPRRRVESEGSGLEYDVKLLLLPAHDYNLELFSLRYQPLFRERAATRRATVETRHGGELRYRRKPYLLRGRFTDDTTETAGTTADVQRLSLGGDYLLELSGDREVSVSAAYDPSRFSTSAGMAGDATQAWLSSHVDLGRVALRSRLTHDRRDQAGGANGRFASEDLLWQEVLTLHLPLRLRADLTHGYREQESHSSGGEPARTLDLASRRRELAGDLSHRLYESLDSRYRFRDDETAASFGDSATTSHGLAFTYRKTIPRGRLLAGLDLARSDTSSSGEVGVANEPHPAVAVPGRLQLAGGNVDLGSVVVLVRSPLPPFELLRLTAGAHYQLAAVGNAVEVVVFALPPQLAVPGTYDLQVSYLTAGHFELRSDTLGYRLSVPLFADRVTPYYQHSELRAEVLAGTFPGAALDATTDVFGLSLARDPLRLRLERQDVRWDVGPYVAWLGELHLTASPGAGTVLSGSLSYLARDYARGRLGTSLASEREVIENAAANLQQRFVGGRMVLSLGGSYSRLRGVVENEAYAVSSSLSWRIGKLDLAAGASLSRAATPGHQLAAARRRSESVHLRVRRTLF